MSEVNTMQWLQKIKFILTMLITIQLITIPVTTTAYAEDDGVIMDLHDDGHDIIDDNDFIMSGLLMFAMPIIGVMSVKSIVQNGTCYSPWIFTAAAVYYGASEIMNWREFKDGQDVALKILQNKDYNLQLQDLESAKASTARARKAVETKVKNAQIAAIGFGVAAAVALAEWYANEAAKATGVASWAVGCLPKSKANEQLASPKAEAKTTMLDEVEKLEDIFSNNISNYKIESYRSTTTITDSSIDQLISIFEGQNRLHSFKLDAYNRLMNSPVPYLLPKNNQFLQLISSTINSIIPPAQAAMTKTEQYGIAAGSVAGLMIYAMADFGEESLWSSMFNGWARSAWYAGAAVVAYGASEEFNNVLKKLKEREAKYDQLIQALTKSYSTQGLENGGEIGYLSQEMAPALPDPNLAPTDNPDDICMTGEEGKAVPIECERCNEINNCKTSEIPENTKFPETMPNELASATSLMQKMQNASYKGDTEAAQLAGNELAQYAGKIRKINKQFQDMANKDRLARGEKPIDFERAQKELMDRYKKSAVAALNKLPADKKNSLLTLAGGGFSSLSPKKDDKLHLKATANVINIQKKKRHKKNPFAGLELDEKTDEATAKPTIAKVADAMLTDNEEYDYSGANDGIHDRNANIFKIITVRYLKSAYPVLLEEDKEVH